MVIYYYTIHAQMFWI